MRITISQEWREAVALSLLFNLALFSLFASITEKSRSRITEYIPVEMIQLSQSQEKEQPAELRPAPPAAEQQPQQETAPEPPKEKEMGIDKTGEEIPQTQAPPQTVYLPQHRVTRVPNFKKQVKPVYPSSERTAGVEAKVIIEAYINEFGGVDDVKIVKSAGRIFDEAVIRAVMESSFNPGYLEGSPVAVKVQIPYVFRLR